MDQSFQKFNKPEENKKDPFKDTFGSVEEFSEALQKIDEVEITNNPINLDKGKRGNIFSCMGSDGGLYVFLNAKGVLKLIGIAQSLDEARAIALENRD